ncbi:MAG: PIN domain-containing protein [Armatimonadaceae bacterium]
MVQGTATDTGPLLALLNTSDPANAVCVSALTTLKAPLLTVQACVAEAMYFLGQMIGYRGQEALWQLIEAERLIVVDLTPVDLRRVRYFMNLYQDRPCDYADACLVALCEREGLEQVFSLDSDFYIYRIKNNRVLNVVPGPLTSQPR